MSFSEAMIPILGQAPARPGQANSVLFLINILGYGGAEIQVVQLALGFKRRGWDTTVVTLLPAHNFVEELERAGVQVECLNMRRGVPDPRALLRLRRILRQRQPQIVHSHVVHANLLARVARLISPAPVLITTAHSMIEGGRLLELAYRFTDRLTDLTTNVSQAAVNRYIRVGAAPVGRIDFVPNGVNLRRFFPNPEGRQRLREELKVDQQFVWLAVGRLSRAKNYSNMIAAFDKLADQNGVLLIAGRGELDAELREEAQRLILLGRIRFLGTRSDVPALMNAADGFVLSSDWEGMPLVLQEASSTGLPIVATDVGGNREVMIDGKTGFIVPRQDPSALAQAMRRVMSLTPEQRLQMGQIAREHMIATFDIEKVLDQWQGVYQKLACKRITA